MRSARVTLMVAVLTVTTACSPSESSPSVSPFTEVIEKYLEMARTDGVAQEQIDVLEEALAKGEVTMEQIVDMQSRVEGCLRDAGFTVRETGMEEILAGSGIMMPGFLANEPEGMDDIGANAVMDECNNRYLGYAQAVYMSEPKVLDQYYAVWDTPEVRQCLIDRGYDVNDDTTPYELNLLTGQDDQDHMTVSGYTSCFP